MASSLLIACGGESSQETGGRESATTEVTAPPYRSPASTAGAEACIDCHRDLVEDWSVTGMARTLQTVEIEELAGLGPVLDGDSGYRYHYTTTAGGESLVLAETHTDRPEHAFGTEVLFAIGSGEIDRSYAVAHGAGMWFSPVEVVTTEVGRHTALAPGAAMKHGQRLSLPITPECLGCHTDAPPPRDFPLNLRPNPAEWQPRGLSCAACHGKAAQHANWQEADLSGEEIESEDPIVSIRDLDRWQELSICAACHLQGDARLVLNGQELGPPPPGGDLLEQRALFVAAESTDDVGFVSQIERMTLSECFLQSEMTCITCHDPHRSLHQGKERDRVRASCTKCHADDSAKRMRTLVGGKPSASACSRLASGAIETHAEQIGDVLREDCVTCHMPRTGVFDVAEVMIHDHFIRRDTSGARGPTAEADLRFPESATGDWRRFRWPGVEAPEHIDDPGLWMMAYASGEHLQRAMEFVDRTPGKAAADLPMYHHVRGSLLESAGRQTDAVTAYERALKLDPALAPSAINLGLLLGRTGDVDRGLELLDRVIERYPRADGALRNRGILRHGRGDLEGFVEDLTRAFQVRPDGALALKLAEFFQRAGDPRSAAEWGRMAAELDPELAR